MKSVIWWNFFYFHIYLRAKHEKCLIYHYTILFIMQYYFILIKLQHSTLLKYLYYQFINLLMPSNTPWIRPFVTLGSFWEFLVKWVVCNDQPFVAVKCEYLQNLFRLLNSSIKAFSADTIRDDVIKLYKEEKIKIQHILQVFIFLFTFFFIYLINIK